MTKAIIALSGGMDSATVLTKLLMDGYEVLPIFFDYGSKHNRHERKCAEQQVEIQRKRIAVYRYNRIHNLCIIDLSIAMSDFKSNLLFTGGPIPEGHYNDASMAQTVVPARNMIFLSFMAGLAESHNAPVIALGIHQGDHAIYPDCRLAFFETMEKAISLGTDGRVRFAAPFLDTDKTGILQYGTQHGTPYHLTRTCYKDQELSCGRCGSCTERLEAWTAIGQKDPIGYEV